MKKFFMFAAMASVALVSCVKNEPAMPVAQQDEISFELPLVAPAVKANVAEITEETFTSDFKVWGYFTAAKQNGTFTAADLYMNGVNVGLTGSVWKATSGKYYWPSNGYLTFVGYAPAGAVATPSVSDDGLKLSEYTVPATADQDLLVSKISYDNVKSKGTGEDNVSGDHSTDTYSDGAQIVFDHALSSIRFSVRAHESIPLTQLAAGDGNPYYTLTVKSITVQNVKSVGTFNQPLTGSPENMQVVLADGSNNGWSAQANPTNYTALTGASVVLTGTKQFVTPDTDPATPAVNKTDLILLPQPTTGINIKVVFNYKSSVMTGDPIEQTLTVPLAQNTAVDPNPSNAIANWYRGTRYTYNLIINLDEITFDPEVTAWVDGATQDVNVDYENATGNN